MAVLAEPSGVAHHAQQQQAGAAMTAAQDLGRRFEEMDFDNDGAQPSPTITRQPASSTYATHACLTLAVPIQYK